MTYMHVASMSSSGGVDRRVAVRRPRNSERCCEVVVIFGLIHGDRSRRILSHEVYYPRLSGPAVPQLRKGTRVELRIPDFDLHPPSMPSLVRGPRVLCTWNGNNTSDQIDGQFKKSSGGGNFYYDGGKNLAFFGCASQYLAVTHGDKHMGTRKQIYFLTNALKISVQSTCIVLSKVTLVFGFKPLTSLRKQRRTFSVPESSVRSDFEGGLPNSFSSA
jgi:hypothetical protein